MEFRDIEPLLGVKIHWETMFSEGTSPPPPSNLCKQSLTQLDYHKHFLAGKDVEVSQARKKLKFR